MNRIVAVLVLCAAFVGIECSASESNSVVYVTVTAPAGLPPVTQLRVGLTYAGRTDTELFPNANTTKAIGFLPAATFVLDLPHSSSGNIGIAIDALSSAGSLVSHGEKTAPLVAGGRTDVTVILGPGNDGDGGVLDSDGGRIMGTGGNAGTGGIPGMGGTTSTGGMGTTGSTQSGGDHADAFVSLDANQPLDARTAVPEAGQDVSVSGADASEDAKAHRCDDAGNCNVCLTTLSLGQPGNYGANSGSSDSTDAFQAFIKTKTNASMTMLRTFTHITDIDLSQYDVIILQALYSNPYDPNSFWAYSDADTAALQDWVTNKGGAVIAMSGYGGFASDVTPLNQLLAPFGIKYNADTIFDSTACTDSLCYCSFGSIPFNNWQGGDPVSSAITTKPDGTILGKVGVFMGRSINCTGDCSVFAKDPNPTANEGSVGVAKIVGTGRVLAWSSAWITYTSQWGLTPDPQYDNITKAAQCVGHTPYTSYVVPQFWSNAFKWVAPYSACF